MRGRGAADDERGGPPIESQVDCSPALAGAHPAEDRPETESQGLIERGKERQKEKDSFHVSELEIDELAAAVHPQRRDPENDHVIQRPSHRSGLPIKKVVE